MFSAPNSEGCNSRSREKFASAVAGPSVSKPRLKGSAEIRSAKNQTISPASASMRPDQLASDVARFACELHTFFLHVFASYRMGSLTHWTYFHNRPTVAFNFSTNPPVSETPNHNLLTVKETAEYLRIPLPQFTTSFKGGRYPRFKLADGGELRNLHWIEIFSGRISRANQRCWWWMMILIFKSYLKHS